jgi:hypothetical protein
VGLGYGQVAYEQVAVQLGGGPSGGSTPSTDDTGGIVVFSSPDPALVTGDTNAVEDVFVRDRVAGTTTRVSVSSAGVEADRAARMPSVSGDGRFVAFVSDATTLVPGVGNGVAQVFVHDTVTATTSVASVSNTGSAADGWCTGASVSGSGRYVAFTTQATNLGAPGGPAAAQLLLRDRQLGTTRWLAPQLGGVAPSGEARSPRISDDGRYVVFSSGDDNLVSGDVNGLRDVFRVDVVTGFVEVVSVHPTGVPAFGHSDVGKMSKDGRFVAFQSLDPNLDPNQSGAAGTAYVRDMTLGATRYVDTVAGAAGIGSVHVSNDGRIASWAVATFGVHSVSLIAYRDLWTTGGPVYVTPNPYVKSWEPALSGDGSTLIFSTQFLAGLPPMLGLVAALLPHHLPIAFCAQLPTSGGCAAAASGVGVPSASTGSFSVHADGVPGRVMGTVLWSVASDTPPTWGTPSSSLCVAPPTRHTGVTSSGGTKGACDGALVLDWFAYTAANPGKAPPLGTTVYAQGWFRDRAAPGTTAHAPALAFTPRP